MAQQGNQRGDLVVSLVGKSAGCFFFSFFYNLCAFRQLRNFSASDALLFTNFLPTAMIGGARRPITAQEGRDRQSWTGLTALSRIT